MLKLGDGILYLVWCMLLTTGYACAELECPLNHIRLVHQDEVASSFAERSPVQFSNVISPLLQFSEGFFHSFDIPNTGQLVFDDDFVLVGLTSQGYEVSYLYFVSNFTFQYSNVADSSDFTTYPINVIASSINEVSLFFDKPILARQVRFSIHSASTSPSGLYYWKLRIFGCKKSEANEKAVIGTSISPTVTQECSSSMVYSTPHVIIVNEANPAGHSNGINAVVITVSLILVLVVVAVVSGVGFTMWHCRRKGQKTSESSPKTSNSASTLNRVINTTNSTDSDLVDNPMYSSYYNSSIIGMANSLAAGTSYIPTVSIASRSRPVTATSSLRVEDDIESTHNMCYAVI